MKLERESKKYMDKMNINYLSKEDFLICEYVIDQLVNIDVDNIYYGKSILINELKEKSLEEIKIFGIDIKNKIIDLLYRTPFNYDFDKDSKFGTEISYSFDESDSLVSKIGIVSGYIVPSKLYELSVYHFVHEYIHMLKDTNYDEYKSFISLGEVIPLFYELMIYNPDEMLKKELLRLRMFWLFENRKDYLLLDYLYLGEWINEFVCETDNDCKCDVYEFMISKIGCYLNSFYYAVILYNMYKDNPKKILDLVSRVLKQEITTLEMLNILNIYGDINGSVFEKELDVIRKVLK